MTALRRTLLALAMLVVLAMSFAFWAVGTDSGTRWIYGQIEEKLPAPLTISNPHGSLLFGLRADRVEWLDVSLRIRATDVGVDARLLPLVDGSVLVEALDAASLSIESDSGEREAEPEPFVVDLPILLSITSSDVRDVDIAIGERRFAVDRLLVSARMLGTRIDLNDVVIVHPSGRVSVSGEFGTAPPYPGDVRADWQLTLANGERLQGILTLDGDVAAYAVAHDLTAPFEIKTTGTVAYGGTLSGDLQNEWGSITLAVGEQTAELRDGRATVSGSLDRADVRLASRLLVEDLDVLVDVDAAVNRDEILVNKLEATGEQGRLELSGRTGWSADAAVDLAFRLQDLAWPPASDHVSQASGRIAGTPLEHRINVRLAGPSGALDLAAAGGIRSDEWAGTLEAAKFEQPKSGTWTLLGSSELRIGRERIVLRETCLRSSLAAGRACVTAARDAGGNVDLAVDINDLPLAVLAARLPLELTASGVVGAEFEGRWASGRLNGEAMLEMDSVAIDGVYGNRPYRLAPDRVLGIARIEDNRLRASIDASTDDPAADLSLRLDLDDLFAPTVAALVATVDDVPLASIVAPYAPGITTTGSVNARVDGSWVNGTISGSAEIFAVDAGFSAEFDGERVDVLIGEAFAKADIDDNRVVSEARIETADARAGGNLQLTIADATNMESAISGSGQVRVADLADVAVLMPLVDRPAGRLAGELALGGSLARPEFAGEIDLTDGEFGIREAGIRVVNAEAQLSQLDAGQLRLTGSASSGVGQVSIVGRTIVGADAGMRAEIRIEGEQFELIRLPDWNVVASPAVDIVLDDRRAVVTGQVGVPRADVTVREAPSSAASTSPDTIVHRADAEEPQRRRRIDIDVRTALGPDVQLAGFGLATRVEGDVRIRGGTHRPYTGSGRLTLRDGRYTAFNQVLDIERGVLIFNGPLDRPQLDITATRQAGDVVAGVRVSGTPQSVVTQVYSEPPHSDAETLSYLFTGRPLSDSTSDDDRFTLNSAAFALGMSGAGSVTSRIRGQLGLESLAVEGGLDDGRIVAGKRINSRLFVEYGYGIVDKLGTLLLRYQLNNRLMLEPRTGTVSNLDLVYSVKKR